MADSLGCCNKTEWELLVLIATQNQATFDRLGQINESIAAGTAAGCPCTSESALQTGNDIAIAVGGTAVQGPNLPATRGILVVANPNNTNPVNVGDSTVTDNTGAKRGIILTAGGMPSQFIAVDNANKIYLNGQTAGDRVGLTVL